MNGLQSSVIHVLLPAVEGRATVSIEGFEHDVIGDEIIGFGRVRHVSIALGAAQAREGLAGAAAATLFTTLPCRMHVGVVEP